RSQAYFLNCSQLHRGVRIEPVLCLKQGQWLNNRDGIHGPSNAVLMPEADREQGWQGCALRHTPCAYEDTSWHSVHVGPPQIAIHEGQTVLVSMPDGQITWPSEKGLYFLDTRMVSNWAIYANGEPWELLNGGPINYHAARIFLTNKSILTED